MIRILLRQCNSKGKSTTRPPWFDQERAFLNLLETMDGGCSLTVMFDGDPHRHFVHKHPVSVVRFSAGSDAASFGKMLVHVRQQAAGWAPEDIVYFVEDDYIHMPGWPNVMREGFSKRVGADMVSLYDHSDKYTEKADPCRLKHTPSCHWRTAVSTTNTFAVRLRTLLEDMDVHARFAAAGAEQGHHSDHEKFLELSRLRLRTLCTSIPGYSTHCESPYLSPCVDWARVMAVPS